MYIASQIVLIGTGNLYLVSFAFSEKNPVSRMFSSALFYLKKTTVSAVSTAAALILFLAPFDPLLSGRKMIYITMETPIASTKYSERKPKYQMQKNPKKTAAYFSLSLSQMLLTCAGSRT